MNNVREIVADMQEVQNGNWCVLEVHSTVLVVLDFQRRGDRQGRSCRSVIGSEGGDRVALGSLEVSSKSLTRVVDDDLLHSEDEKRGASKRYFRKTSCSVPKMEVV